MSRKVYVLVLASFLLLSTVTPAFAELGGGSLCCDYCVTWVDGMTGCCSDSPVGLADPWLANCEGITFCYAEAGGPTDCHATCTGSACVFV